MVRPWRDTWALAVIKKNQLAGTLSMKNKLR